jgi:hypothetical protein
MKIWLHLRNTQRVLDLLRTFVEIVAIPTAGLWAYFHFASVESPELNTRLGLETSVEWNAAPGGKCLANFHVDIDNRGKRVFDIDSARIAVWITPFPSSRKPVVALEPTYLWGTAAVSDTVYRDRLNGHYEASQGANEVFTFAVAQAPQKFALFYAMLWGRVDGHPKPEDWQEYSWDWLCGNPRAAAKSPAALP